MLTMKSARKIHHKTFTIVTMVEAGDGSQHHKRVRRTIYVPFRVWLRTEYKGCSFASPKALRILGVVS